MNNLTPTDCIADSITDRSFPPTAQEGANALLEAGLAVMGLLEASLHISRKALLALDLASIERETGVQAALVREFDVLCPGMRRPARSKQTAEDAKSRSSPGSPGLEEKFRRTTKKILEAVRLQAALLSRARSKLGVLANMLAGPSATYGPFGQRTDRPGQSSFC